MPKCKENMFGFSYSNFVNYMYRPMDPSSLGIIRIFFGLLMLLDLPEERGGADIDVRYGNPRDCHFPLFQTITPLGLHYMSLLYGLMWIGAMGVMLGYKFRISTMLFGIPYWYLFLLDKSFWNNHSYLYGIVTILFMGSSANHYCSIDGFLDKEIKNTHVPYWNYFILKFQFFLLYFFAGLKKADMEWLEGYSMTDLGSHYVFAPFQLLLTIEQIDYYIVHWFGFILDLTIGFWMLLDYTRPVALLFCASFHLMNSRLFSIGMFPYVCLATLPLFCEENWPRKLRNLLMKTKFDSSPSNVCIYNDDQIEEFNCKHLRVTSNWKDRLVVGLLMSHCLIQTTLPYSHSITKGYNNWTKGLYGYSWDMMVHSWDTILVMVKIIDNDSGQEHFLDPDAWVLNNRWTKHADMCVQYAECVKCNLLSTSYGGGTMKENRKSKLMNEESNFIISVNISIYIDVWCSLNGRFQQRMFNPNYDLLQAKWSPFENVEWLLPLLSEYNVFRNTMNEITKQVYQWSNHSDVLFIADFPGLYLENFIAEELENVTLTVLEGSIIIENEDPQNLQCLAAKLDKASSMPVEVGTFHRIHTIGKLPSCYMYTYINVTKGNVQDDTTFQKVEGKRKGYSPFPILGDVQFRVNSLIKMMTHIFESIQYVMFNNSRKIYNLKVSY